jgi:hypothetical protein
MKIEDVKALTPINRLLYWIKERESIRFKKEAREPWPWTDDTILSSYRFCNVRRMDDKVSKWLLANWYKPHKDHPNMLPAVALARFFNLPSSLAGLSSMLFSSQKIDWGKVRKHLRTAKKSGPIFNAAYMVRGNDGRDKVESVIDYTILPLFKNPVEINTSSIQETHAALKDRYGFGSFMAGQVVADLRWAISGAWKDKKTWAPVGPGSSRGMCRLFGDPLKLIKQRRFEQLLAGVTEILSENLSPDLTKRLEAIDWQNCLCELDKYSRVLAGKGRPKQLYKGPN